MPREFEPWIAVKVGVRKNRKLTALPDDSARYGWIAGVLAEAKLQRPGGRFDSRGQLEEAIGRFASFVDNYLSVGLLEPASRLCPACRKVWTHLPDGSLVVHDWRGHQRDPFSAVRSAEWRSDQENDERTTDERNTNDARTTDDHGANAGSNGVVTSDDTADSRARGETDTETDTTTPDVDTGDSSPQPPGRAGGRSSRANGTNPRAVEAAAGSQVREADGAKNYRAQQRRLASYRGAINEDQLREMNARDAELSEIPDWETHLAEVRRSSVPTLDQL